MSQSVPLLIAAAIFGLSLQIKSGGAPTVEPPADSPREEPVRWSWEEPDPGTLDPAVFAAREDAARAKAEAGSRWLQAEAAVKAEALANPDVPADVRADAQAKSDAERPRPQTYADRRQAWSEMPEPVAPLPPPLEPLPDEEVRTLREEIAAFLREGAGENRLLRVRPIGGVRVAWWDCPDQYRVYKDEPKQHRPELYALFEQHLDLADVLLQSDEREVRESGLGVATQVLSCLLMDLDEGRLAAAVAEAYLVPHLDSASPNKAYILSELDLVGDAAWAFREGGRWKRYEQACGEALRLIPENRNQSDVWRVSLHKALKAQRRYGEAAVVLRDIHDLVALKTYYLSVLAVERNTKAPAAEEPAEPPVKVATPEAGSPDAGSPDAGADEAGAPLPPRLEPLPDEEVRRLRETLLATLRRRAGKFALWQVRPIDGVPVNHWDCLDRYLEFEGDYQNRRPELHALLEQHLRLAADLLEQDEREVRESGLGVVQWASVCAWMYLDDGPLAADIAEAYLIPHLDAAAAAGAEPLAAPDREDLLTAATTAFKTGGRWERWGRACGEMIRLIPADRSRSDLWRIQLYKALAAQDRRDDAHAVLRDVRAPGASRLRDHYLANPWTPAGGDLPRTPGETTENAAENGAAENGAAENGAPG